MEFSKEIRLPFPRVNHTDAGGFDAKVGTAAPFNTAAVAVELRKAASVYFHANLLKAIAGKKAYIAGGSLEALLTGRKVEDVDIFCASATCVKQVLTSLEPYIVEKVNGPVVTIFMENGLHTVQVILDEELSYHNVTDFMAANFDYTCCQCALSVSADGEAKLWYHDDFFSHVSQRVLVFGSEKRLRTRKRTVTTSLIRLVKYANRGYRAPDVTLNCILRAAASLGMSELDYSVSDYEQDVEKKYRRKDVYDSYL